MQVIHIQNNDEINWFRVTVECDAALNWKYRYLDDGFAHQNTSHGTPPFRHALGFFPEKLNDTDMWSFTVQNYTGKKQSYTLLMEWFQGKQLTNTWKHQADIGPDETQSPRDGVRYDAKS